MVTDALAFFPVVVVIGVIPGPVLILRACVVIADADPDFARDVGAGLARVPQSEHGVLRIGGVGDRLLAAALRIFPADEAAVAITCRASSSHFTLALIIGRSVPASASAIVCSERT